MISKTPAFNTSTRIDCRELAAGECISLVAHGGSSRRLSAHYMVIDTSAATPIRGEWPHDATGLMAARAAFAKATVAL
jgi:hypothetical protein